jgi:hypothetical protein
VDFRLTDRRKNGIVASSANHLIDKEREKDLINRPTLGPVGQIFPSINTEDFDIELNETHFQVTRLTL